MSSLKNNINFNHFTTSHEVRDALHINGYHSPFPRSRTPNGRYTPANLPHMAATTTSGSELSADEDPKSAIFKELLRRSEARLSALFGEDGGIQVGVQPENIVDAHIGGSEDSLPPTTLEPPKKAARTIDEDDYDESDGEDGDAGASASPLKAKRSVASATPGLSSINVFRGTPPCSAPASTKGNISANIVKTSEDARKKLEMDKRATEDAAKRSFHTLFHTLENDKDAMLEQKKLEESEHQVDVELNGTGPSNSHPSSSSGNPHQGTLSQTNLGASSLTLKHLIARIDAKRDQVRASDADLRTLISEVRKNRSKWASADKIGQEELYEAAEKVLCELKAMTEHSTAFLTRVNKREAPDYYNVIKHAMDLGTMTKKLKNVQYKSKQDFVADLNLIWDNCLKYNANPEHFLRRHALFMRKETEKLVPLIPAIVIRDRAAVEAEERRLHHGEAEADGLEESDDEPIISSRGRKAPGKKAKKGSSARKAPAGLSEGSPAPDTRALTHMLPNGLGSNLKRESFRADSETLIDGTFTPPPGSSTPAGVNGIVSHGTFHSHDPMDIDGSDVSLNAMGLSNGRFTEEAEIDDVEYKAWKQVTKKDRALVTAERHRLFIGNRINPDEPAQLRTRSGMRRWLRKQKEAISGRSAGKGGALTESAFAIGPEPCAETLAEGIEGDEERVLPDYYDPLSAVPDIAPRLRWVEDSLGQVQESSEEYLRILPPGSFMSRESSLTKRTDENMKQMQATRKICSKIAIVKQMQLQSQMYHGQFQKHEPVPLVEQDIEPHVLSDEGPVMAPSVSRAALQRSVGKIFFHAGFEEFQPAALEAATDIAADFFYKITRTLVEYSQAPRVPVRYRSAGTTGEPEIRWKKRFTTEEMILHSLHENGSDIETLDAYVKDELERASAKLGVMHERMKAHLADLLRPALTDAGPDGSYAFNDGSEQFVGGDFAEDLDEDFFGFKELGLDKEFGLASLSVPLHLLQNRMHHANQSQNMSALSSNLPSALPPPRPLPPLTTKTLAQQIRLVHNFFQAKLHAPPTHSTTTTTNTTATAAATATAATSSNDNTNDNSNATTTSGSETLISLVEDDDLPQKQRFPKPRLPPTGKISSPRKRPIREPGPGKGHPRKKMKLTDEKEREKEKMMDRVDKLAVEVKVEGATGTGTSNGHVVTGNDSVGAAVDMEGNPDAVMERGNSTAGGIKGDAVDTSGGGGVVGGSNSDGGGAGAGAGLSAGAGTGLSTGGMISPESLEAH